MKYTMAQYTVRPEKVAEVKKAIAEFLSEIKKNEPRTLYLVFRENGRHTFVHWMRFENEAAERRHSQARYNDRFVKRLLPNCVGKAAFSEYGLFGATKKNWPLTREA
jgi:quinol monooxygenase YgiN